MDQYRIPCVIMRAGTSKGIFLKENDLPAPGPVSFGCIFCRAALLAVALLLSGSISCPSSPLACSLFWHAPTAFRFAPWATTVPAARRSLPRLAPSVRASPRGTACTDTLSCSAQAPNVAPAKGGFCGAPALPGSIGPGACIAGTRCAAILAPAPPPVATYTYDKTPVLRRSPAAPALSVLWYLPRRALLMLLFCCVQWCILYGLLLPAGRKKGAAPQDCADEKGSACRSGRCSLVSLCCFLNPPGPHKLAGGLYANISPVCLIVKISPCPVRQLVNCAGLLRVMPP